jgi:hypothetical protein
MAIPPDANRIGCIQCRDWYLELVLAEQDNDYHGDKISPSNERPKQVLRFEKYMPTLIWLRILEK